MRHFSGRVAVVAGAGSGAGRAFADAAAHLGMRLVLADLHAAALERAAGALQAGGGDVLALVCDMANPAHVEELADAAMARFHGVHLLFNAAGAAGAAGVDRGPVWARSTADWEALLGTSLWSAIHGVRVFVPLMLECARRDGDYDGHIVNVVDAAPPSGLAAQGVVALSEALRDDLRRAGAPIGVSVLYPGAAPAAAPFEAIRRGDFAC